MRLAEPVKRVLGLEPGDLGRAAPLVIAHALTLATIYVLKPARNALFLEQVGVEQLPWVLILVALAGGLFVAVYTRFAALVRTDRLMQATLLSVIAMLLAFRGLLQLEARWTYFAFFVWVQLFGLVTTSLVWLWANGAFDPRRARRVFGLIGTGGIVGAIVGGVFTGSLASGVGTPNLLFVASGLVGMVLLALRFAPPVRAPRSAPKRKARGRERPAEGPRRALPRLLAANAALIAIAAVFVDIQFNDVVQRNLAGSEAKAAFFGVFFACVSGFSLVFQLVVTPWLLRRFGVGSALAILPGALGVGSAVLVLGPVFPLATLPKAADGSFRHSVHKAASELLFLPIPDRIKQRTKLFIDTTVDTAATGLGALAVVGLTQGLGLSYRHLAFFTITFIAGSLLLVRPVRRMYVDAFRRAIEGRHIDLENLTVGLTEASVLDLLLPALRSEQPRRVLPALELLTSVRTSAVRDAVAPLLDHEDAQVRLRALEVLGGDRSTFAADGRPRRLHDEDDEVRATALLQWVRSDPAGAEATLQAWLDADDPARVATALRAASALPEARRRTALADDRLDRLERLATEHVAVAAALARALAGASDSRFDARLERLLEHASAPVLDGAIEGFAESADPAFIPWLLDRLEDRRTRAAARRALAAFGDEVVDELTQLVDDPARAVTARRAAIRALADIGGDPAVSALMARLRHGEPALAREVVDALTRIRRREPDRRFPRVAVRDAIRARVEEWRLILASRHRLPPPDGEATRLFHRAMAEKAERLRGEIFGLLGLRYDPRAMFDAERRLADSEDRKRSAALEFLENAVEPEIVRPLLPLLEADGEIALRRTDTELGALPRQPGRLLHAWSRSNDPWLSACALYAAPYIDASVDPGSWSSNDELHPLVKEVLGSGASARTA